MKKFKTFFTACLMVVFMPAVANANNVKLTIKDGISQQQVKQRMEASVSELFSNINYAQEKNLSRVDFTSINMTEAAKSDVAKLWENQRLMCPDREIVSHCITTKKGYQLRGLPLIIIPLDKNEEQAYQEAVINFDKKGTMQSFSFTINPELYSKLIQTVTSKKSNEVVEISERQQILDFVEQFRTSYNQKDIKFLQQVFSEDALIITGHVVKTKANEVLPAANKVIYTQQTKKEYLANLQRAFRTSKYIKVNFNDITIVKHPTKQHFYGVTVKQQWNASRYSDEGYVFMLWDFRNAKHPQIHVRTWQPEYLDKSSGQKLSPDEVFSLNDFNI